MRTTTYRYKGGRTKVVTGPMRMRGPVGARKTAAELALLDVRPMALAGVLDLEACRQCGFAVCDCENAGVECARAHAAAEGIDRVHRELQEQYDRAMGEILLSSLAKLAPRVCEHCGPLLGQAVHLCPAKVGARRCERCRATCPGEAKPNEPAAEGVAPGWWREVTKGDVVEKLRHASGAFVARCNGFNGDNVVRWYYAASGDRSDAAAPTRDEAMALALGWVPARVRDDVDGWELKDAPNGMCVSQCPDGTWYAIDATGAGAGGCGSLPHAIAWCMGHA